MMPGASKMRSIKRLTMCKPTPFMANRYITTKPIPKICNFRLSGMIKKIINKIISDVKNPKLPIHNILLIYKR